MSLDFGGGQLRDGEDEGAWNGKLVGLRANFSKIWVWDGVAGR